MLGFALKWIFLLIDQILAIEMGGVCIEQKVMFENIPRYCTNYKHLGHDTKGYKWIQKVEEKKDSKETPTIEEIQNKNKASTSHKNDLS